MHLFTSFLQVGTQEDPCVMLGLKYAAHCTSGQVLGAVVDK